MTVLPVVTDMLRVAVPGILNAVAVPRPVGLDAASFIPATREVTCTLNVIHVIPGIHSSISATASYG